MTATVEDRLTVTVADINAAARNAQPGALYGRERTPGLGTCRVCRLDVQVTKHGSPHPHGPHRACPGRHQEAA